MKWKDVFLYIIGLLFLIMGLLSYVATLQNGYIEGLNEVSYIIGLPSLIMGLLFFVMALLAGRIGAVKRAFLHSIGLFSLFMGLLLFVGFLLGGQISASLISLAIAIGGAYAAYYPYKRMGNFVARPAAFKDVFYDDKGLYYDTRGKPYLITWDEVKEYRILSVTEIDENVRGIGVTLMPILKIPFDLARYIAWRKIDPEYASTGIMKLGTVQFIKKDGSSIVLTHVLNPYRLIPIFDRYIVENSQKKGYHM